MADGSLIEAAAGAAQPEPGSWWQRTGRWLLARSAYVFIGPDDSAAYKPLSSHPLSGAEATNSVDKSAAGVGNGGNRSPELTTFVEHGQSKWRKCCSFIGPGYMVSVGYMDPGNWATDIGGGARFGYTLLFVVLLSSLAAMVLQVLCIKLGVVTGRDLAQQCRHHFGRNTRYLLYALAEVAIMATDLAEVIGSAIALNLLFKLPLPWGVVITGLDVLIIMRWWGTNRKSNRYYEFVVIALVAIVAICFIIQLVYVQPSLAGILRGFLPSTEIFTNPQMLYVAIGILGATVMPHNLYLHSSICKDRRMVVGETKRERSATADSGAPLSPRGRAGSATSDGNWIELYARSPSSPLANPLRNRSRSPSMTAVTPTSGTIQKEPATLLLIDDPRPVDGASVTSPIHVSVDISGTGRSDITVAADSSRTRASTDADETILTSDKATGYSDKSIRSTIYYASIDCIIALVMAMFVNATILIVAAAAFWQKGIHDVQELQDAYRSLEEYVGQGVGTVFALALLASGQSSTLTGTMAGQIVMEGFLGLRMRPIVRRLITRMFAIVPALAVALGVGERGLNSLLILSQVVLSATLPFAVIPLVYFTNSREHMGEQAKRQFTNGRVLRVASWAIAVIVTMLNLYLLIAAIVL